MDVLSLGWKLEINKFHVLPSAEAEILHEGLKKDLSPGKTKGQGSNYDSVEDL